MSESIRFENYELLRHPDGSTFELGRGAMGVTYKARDTDLHCDVALKVISPEIIGNPDVRERFLREARAAAKLRHPNIATVFRLGVTPEGTHYYAMEFCDGLTLHQALAGWGTLPALNAVHLGWQVSKALGVAERHRIIHRDLKPSNLILTEPPDEGLVVKVIDFGLAKTFGDAQQSLSGAGFAGTAHFASPEQIDESDLDIRSDIYSLGVVVWFMLTGQPPFQGSLARVMSQTLSAELPWAKLAGQPECVIALLRRMLAKKRDDRPASAVVLRTEMEACLRALETSPDVSGTPAEVPTLNHGAASSSADEQPTKPAPKGGTDAERLAARFQLGERLGRDPLGRLFRATDRENGGAAVTYRVIEPTLLAVPATRRELDAQLAAARAHPHPNLVNVLASAATGQGLIVVTEQLAGFTLLELLKHRGALPAHEALLLLTPLATAADHATTHGLRGFTLRKGQTWVHFPDDASGENRRHALTEPIGTWSPHGLKVEALSLGGSGSGDDEALQSMATLATAGQGFGCVQHTAPAALAHLACELLGGSGGGTFTPLARLSESANAILRHACTDPAGFSSATEFVEKFREALGRVGRSAPMARASASPVSANSSPASSSSFKPLAMVAFALLLTGGLGAGYWFGIHQPRERDREKREADAEASKNESPASAHTAAKPPVTDFVASALPTKETANKREEEETKAEHPEVKKDTVKAATSDETPAKSRLTVEERFNRVRALLQKAFSDKTYSAALSCLKARSKTGDLRGLKGDLGWASDLENHIGYSADPSLATVSRAQAESGTLEGAMRTAEGISDKSLKVSALTEVAVVQAHQGNQADALRTLRRAKAIADEVGGIAKVIKYPNGIRAVDSDEVELKAALLGNIATAYAGIGEFDEGKRLYAEAEKLPDTNEAMLAFNSMWELVALKHFEHKEFGEAYQAMDKLKNDNHSIEVEKALGWRRVAEALIRKNRLDLAERVVSEYIPKHVTQDDSLGSQPDIGVLTEIAMAYASIGDRIGFLQSIDQAVTSARTCSDTSIWRRTDPFCPRVDALMDIARTCARAGDQKRFENIMSEAFTVLERLPEKDFRPVALEAIACAQADAGYIDRGRETMKRITHKNAGHNFTEAIVGRLAEEGRYEEAEAIVPHPSEEARSCYRLIIRGLLLDEKRLALAAAVASHDEAPVSAAPPSPPPASPSLMPPQPTVAAIPSPAIRPPEKTWDRPHIYLQIAAESQRGAATELKQRLAKAGCTVVGIENVSGKDMDDEIPTESSEFRYFTPSDSGEAQRITREVTSFFGDTGIYADLPAAQPYVSHARQYEIWFSRAFAAVPALAAPVLSVRKAVRAPALPPLPAMPPPASKSAPKPAAGNSLQDKTRAFDKM